MKQALDQARAGRLHVLAKMNEVIKTSRGEISEYAPRIVSISIDPEKIREVIGPGGKVIREIQSRTGAEIEIEDDGNVNVAAVEAESANAAIEMIQQITAVPEVGTIYDGTVSRLMNFGAFVSFMGSKEGLVHISEMAPGRVEEVEDAVQVGDEIKVKVVEIDKMGRLNLSKVQAELDLGLLSDEEAEQVRSGGGGGGRDRDRGGRGGGGRDRDRGGRGGGRGGGGGRDRDRGGRGGGGGGRRR
jgi:polyribonucleotide nucleotidyltransferase